MFCNAMMSLTTYLAEIFGLYMALLGVFMLVRKQAMIDLMAAFGESRPLIYVLATLRVLIGLAIILAHNRWTDMLPAAVTLLGWITLLRGVILLVLPHQTERKALIFFQRSGPYYAIALIAIVRTWSRPCLRWFCRLNQHLSAFHGPGSLSIPSWRSPNDK